MCIHKHEKHCSHNVPFAQNTWLSPKNNVISALYGFPATAAPFLFCSDILDGWERSTIADWSSLKSHFALCPRVARWPVTVSMLTPGRSFCHQGSRKVDFHLYLWLCCSTYDAFAHANTEEQRLLFVYQSFHNQRWSWCIWCMCTITSAKRW